MFFQKMKKSFKKQDLCFFGLQDYPLENPGYCTATKKGRQMYRIFSEPFTPSYTYAPYTFLVQKIF